jgi:nitrogen regulatory protein PII
MAFLVVLVLDDPDKTTDVLEMWEGTGVSGVTIFESTGLGRLRRSGIIDDLPLIPSLSAVLKGRETHHRTLFSVVHDQAQVEALVAATEAVVGDLDQENTGFIYVVPVSQVYGLRDGPWAAEDEAGG